MSTNPVLQQINRRLIALVALVFLVACVMPIHAAPPSPGSVISPIDKPVYKPERTQTPQITRDKAPAPKAPESALKVMVNSFTFKGNTTYDDATLKEVVAQYEGKEYSISDIYFVADVVESYYRYHGYLLTSVYVPAQKINSGTIILEVIEGRLGEIRFDGTLDIYTEAFLAKQIDGLQPGEIIDDKALEQETLLLGDLPGLDARAVIKPGEEYGASDVTFLVEEDRYSGVISVNNYGRESIGENRVDAGLLIANPFFEGDSLNLSGIAAEGGHMYYARADYDALVNTSGSRVGFSVSYFDYDVDTEEAGLPPTLELNGNGSTFIIHASHPLQRSAKTNTTLIVNGRHSSTEEEQNTGLPSRDTDINLLEVFLAWDHLYHDYAQTSVQVGVTTNFKSRENVLDDDTQKAKVTLDVRHYEPFLESWFMIGRVQGTWSPDPLVDVERFRIGGQGSVRAYPSAELAGDYGGVLSLDVGKNFIASDDLVLTPRIFVDAGKVYNSDDFGLVSLGFPKSESLTGYGVGLSISYLQTHTLDLEVVEPVTDRVSSDGEDTRFWANYRGFF